MLRALASLAERRPRRVLAVAFAATVAAAAVGGGVADRLDPYGARDPATDSAKGSALLERSGVEPQPGVIALVRTPDRGKLRRVTREMKHERLVARVVPGPRARGGGATYLSGFFRVSGDKKQQEAADRIKDALAKEDGVKVGGQALVNRQANAQVSKDLERAELLAFPILFLLSLLFFRSAVAAGLPLLIGCMSIVGTFFGIAVVSELTSVSVFSLNLVTGLGLGLAIDYSLFIVSRYREEVARTGPGPEALRRTLATAGRTVLFSSLTVAAALASLLVFPQRFLYSMGIGGMLVALIAAAISLVVLPALLALLGERVNALSPRWLRRSAERDARPATSGAWYRLSRLVMRRPGAIAAGTTLLLLLLAVPFLGIKFTSVDAQVLPREASARQVDSALRAEFPPHRTTPVTVAVTGRPGSPAMRRYSRRLARLEGVAHVSPAHPDARGIARIDVISRYGATEDRSQDLVRDIRALDAPFTALADGQTARLVDLKSSLAGHLPLAFTIVSLATFLVLFLMTGSVVLPVKALLMNVLSLSATLGILVFVFQDGRLEGLLGYTSQGALEATMPVLLFAVAFGLSTDYGVFLLSRIKEARDSGTGDSEAVAVGLERTGRIVTAAALLFAVAIGAFATSKMIFIKENGVGTAIAVLIDASIIRALLVPSLMELLGRWNWWAPAPLRRLHERFGLSEGEPAREPVPAAAGGASS